MTKVLKLCLLGPLQLAYDDHPLPDLVSGKAQALLCYLAMQPRPHARQTLAGLLWGEMPEADARRNLRGVIMKLRQVAAPNLIITHHTVAFDPHSHYWLDVRAFREQVTQPMNALTPAAWQQALALYRGEFLAELHVRDAPAFEDWAEGQRTQLRQLALNGYEKLAALYHQQGEYQAGIETAHRLLRLEPVREATHQRLMQLLADSGQRALALAQYETCRQLLWDELGVEVSSQTAELAAQIRSGAPSRHSLVLSRQSLVLSHQSSVISHQSSAPDLPPPFIAGPPITHPARFFGREQIVKRLFALFRQRPLQNAAIIGPRRSGKTSLLHYLKTITTTPANQLRPGQRRDWLPDPARYHWIFVDFQDPRLGTRDGLLRYLLAHMDLPTPARCDLETFMDAVADSMRTPTIILLDEIGVAMSRYAELDDAFWESMRALATNLVDGHLGFVLASAVLPGDLAHNQGLGSPFFNIFGYAATLGPLTEPEARQLIAASPIPFPEDDETWIMAQSGGWPLLLQILCRERLLALEEGGTGDQWRDEARRQIAPFLTLKDGA